MKENETGLYNQVTKFCDVHTYLVYRLTGQYKTSMASADPMGLLELENMRWSKEILDQLDITPQQLPDAFIPGTVLGYVTKEACCDNWLKIRNKSCCRRW